MVGSRPPKPEGQISVYVSVRVRFESEKKRMGDGRNCQCGNRMCLSMRGDCLPDMASEGGEAVEAVAGVEGSKQGGRRNTGRMMRPVIEDEG